VALSASRHRRELGVGRILHDGDAAKLLNRPESSGAIVEVAGQDDADGARPEHLGRRAEQRIDGRPEPVLVWPSGDADPPRFDDEVTVGRGNVDAAGL
jgi:hypothetical protein